MAQTTARRFEPGTCLELTLADGETATYMVEREWGTDDDDETTAGLKVKRVTADYPTTLPRYRASLLPDDGILRDNYADDDEPETYTVDQITVLSTEDRMRIEGTLDSPRASHVQSAVIDAIQSVNTVDDAPADDPMFAASELVRPEEFTLYAPGEHSDCEGPVLVCTAATDLQTRENIRQSLRAALNDGYGVWCIRKGVWEFHYGDGGVEKPVR